MSFIAEELEGEFILYIISVKLYACLHNFFIVFAKLKELNSIKKNGLTFLIYLSY